MLSESLITGGTFEHCYFIFVNCVIAEVKTFLLVDSLCVCVFKYSARRNKVKRVREGLENSLKGRIELIESYAKVCFHYQTLAPASLTHS